MRIAYVVGGNGFLLLFGEGSVSMLALGLCSVDDGVKTAWLVLIL